MFYNAKNKEIKIDDTSAYYVSFGTGKKNLIIIPGVGDGFKLVKGMAIPFAIMYKLFAKDYKVYIFSRRNKIPNNFTIEDMANDLITHMNDLNIKKTDIVGVSQGGMIAQYVAINAKDKVNKLVLAVTIPKKNEIIEESINTWIDYAKKKDFKGLMIDTAKRSYTGKYLNKQLKYSKLLGLFGKNATYERFIQEAEACLKHNSVDKLNTINCKTLIIGAKQDKSLGYKGSIELHENIKDSELYLYEEYSHGVYEQAKDFNERIYDFLKGE